MRKDSVYVVIVEDIFDYSPTCAAFRKFDDAVKYIVDEEIAEKDPYTRERIVDVLKENFYYPTGDRFSYCIEEVVIH